MGVFLIGNTLSLHQWCSTFQDWLGILVPMSDFSLVLLSVYFRGKCGCNKNVINVWVLLSDCIVKTLISQHKANEIHWNIEREILNMVCTKKINSSFVVSAIWKHLYAILSHSLRWAWCIDIISCHLLLSLEKRILKSNISDYVIDCDNT